MLLIKYKAFDFTDDLKAVNIYQEVFGAHVTVDDPANGIMYVEYDVQDDPMNMLTFMEQVGEYGLEPFLEVNGTVYPYKEGLKVIDEITANVYSFLN
jgi:hypothetical protein